MSAEDIPAAVRVKDAFHHIDMGFLNRRLCITALPPELRDRYIERAKPGSDHMTVLGNDHLLVTMLLDACQALDVPILAESIPLAQPTHMFRSTERLSPCLEIYEAARVSHLVELSVDFGKPVRIAYHTEHLVSSTGKMTLAEGSTSGYVQSIVGLVHDKSSHYEVEPLVIGAPWFDHPRNGTDSKVLMWAGLDFGEILPEDIDQFSKMRDVQVGSADEWMEVMRRLPEAKIKSAFAGLLAEPSKKDWGGEANDHFSASLSLVGRRKTAAFLLKGPAEFREMTLDMCGKRADQIYRLSKTGADILVVQSAHLIGEAVRATLRNSAVFPGQHRKFCLIDGQATYRILKAYSLL
jgi:hypothetical protein